MKPIAAALLAFVLVACSSIPVGFASDRSALIKRILASTVRVEFTFDDGSTQTCTGFMVGKHEALTAEHCVPKWDTAVTVDDTDGQVVMETDSLALINVPDVRKVPLELRKEPLVVGQPIVTLGFGFGFMRVYQRALAAEMGTDVVLDGPLVPGMSGGPMVDLQGHVVGINQASSPTEGLGCGAGEIALFLSTPRPK